jgi:hypothetical protein
MIVQCRTIRRDSGRADAGRSISVAVRPQAQAAIDPI